MGGKSSAEHWGEMGAMADWQRMLQSGKLYRQTQPARQQFYGAWGDIGRGEMPFGETAFPAMMQAARGPIEQQYDVARENIMGMIPQGGRLGEALTDVEIARSQGLQNIVADYLMDQINKMYGAAFQAPQVSIAGLRGVGELGVQARGQMAQAWNVCCFNFLEAEGEIYSTVRRYRDEHYPKTGPVARGYRRSARILVRLMRKSEIFKQLIRITMTKPLKFYSQWYYGENRHGFVFRPIAEGWVILWRLLGIRGN